MSGVVVHGHGFDGSRVERAFRQAAEEQMRRAMLAIEAETRRRAPFRTGHLRRSIASVVTVHGNTIVGTIGTAVRYAPYLEAGTGLYGPRNQRIVPVKARALRFPAGGSPSVFQGGQRVQGSVGPGFRLSGQQRAGAAGGQAQYVFARSVKGIQPRRFFADAMLVARGIAQREIAVIPVVARKKLGLAR